jgi:hypothetical protein
MTLTVGLAAEPEDPFAEAVRQMNRVAFADGNETLKRALLAADNLDDMGYFPCGDASCDVRVHTDADGVRLEVGYDFPL